MAHQCTNVSTSNKPQLLAACVTGFQETDTNCTLQVMR